MNNKIKELAGQAGILLVPAQFSGVLEVEETNEFDLQKFAELIIQECAASLWTEECYTSDLALEQYNRNNNKMIKQHFEQ